MPSYISQVTQLTSGEERDTKDTLGPNAPLGRLALCTVSRHTLAEIFTILPQSVRNHDMAHLSTEHGLTLNAMTNIINYSQMWGKHPVPRSTMFKKLQVAMRDVPGYKSGGLPRHHTETFPILIPWI